MCTNTLDANLCEGECAKVCVRNECICTHLHVPIQAERECVSMQMCQRKYVRVHMHMSICVYDCGYGAALES